MANYRILVFGAGDDLPDSISSAVRHMASDFGVHLGDELEVIAGKDAQSSSIATVAVFLGSNPAPTFSANWVLNTGIPMVPVVSDLKNFSNEIPKNISHLNGMALNQRDAPTAIAAVLLENLRLLPSQRRVFLSYVRKEATEAALQLFSDLEARQLRTFVDTHGVRPGVKFQAELWHQLCDCDVMIMLDTPSYFDRQWTRAEFGKANLKKAAVLRVVFPDVKRNDALGVTDLVQLQHFEVEASGRLTAAAVDRIGDKVESLRSRSVAMRHAGIVSALKSAVDELGGSMLAAGAMRRIEIQLPRGKTIFAYPAVGVPTATMLNEIADHAEAKNAAIVYDRLGIKDEWITHLSWLGQHVPEVRWVQSLTAAWDLSDWDAEQ